MTENETFAKIDAIRSDLKQVVRPAQIRRLRADLNAALDSLSDDQLAAYAAHRRQA